MVNNQGVSRRDALKATGAAATAGMVGLSGCSALNNLLGSGADVTIASTSTGSSSYATGQALAYAASQTDADVDISIQTSQGWTANVRAYANGDFNTISVDNNSLSKAIAGEGPYSDADFTQEDLPYQGFVFTSLEMFWLARDGSGIQTVSDLRDGGYTIYPIEPGFGTNLMTREILDNAGILQANEVNKSDTGDAPGAVNQGDVDALVVYGQNGITLSGWCEQVYTQAQDGLHLVETDSQYETTIEETSGARLIKSKPASRYSNIGADTGGDEITENVSEVASWVLDGQWAFGSEVAAEDARAVAELVHNHWDVMRESEESVKDYSDPATMTAAVMDNHPVHPGIAQFFKDKGVWNSNWEEGSVE